ncbi:PKD domain-containing protein [Gracilimonas sp.]|uniref:PKD domain-containing protein n=1 Tax=Gracilimonas sp. TaxID=1974203 RepID=UPI0032EC9A8D
MKRITISTYLLLLFVLCPFVSVQAQELFLSISGTNTDFKSGDSRHQYDIWIKPEANAPKAMLQLYDAGIGGTIDQITTPNANTTTSYRIYTFDELYSLDGNQVVEKQKNESVLETLSVKNEERFKGRWINFFVLNEEAENGYIVRVTTDGGNDVNNFDLRVMNTVGEPLRNQPWKIITIDLAIGFFDMPPDQSLQIKPHNPGFIIPELVIDGEEDSKVEITDALGNTYPFNQPGNRIPESNLGIENEWAVNISGSKQILNNIAIYGKEQPTLWLYEEQFSSTEKPEFEIQTTTANNCTDKIFRLSSNLFSQRDMQNAQWKVDGRTVATGFSPTIPFSVRGNQTVSVMIPNPVSSALPEYWIASTEVNITSPPIARLYSPKEIIAPEEVITLSAEESYDLGREELNYTWFINGRPAGNGPTFDFSSPDEGSYIISVRVNNGGDIIRCNNSQRQIRIRVNSQPYAEIEYDSTFQTGQYLTFSVANDKDINNDSLSFEWEGLGVVSSDITAREVVISHMATGTFEVSLTVDDNTNTENSSYTITRNYTVIPPVRNIQPVSQDSSVADTIRAKPITENIKTNDEVIAEDSVVNSALAFEPDSFISAPRISSASKVGFTVNDSLTTAADTGSVVYEWDFGDGTVATGIQPSHLYEKPGTYAVNVSIRKGDEIQKKRHVIVINEYPVASFNVADTLAAGHSFRVDGTQSIDNDGFVTNYQWYIDGVPAASGPSPSLMISDPGEHTISLRVQDNSGHENAQDLSSKDVWVNHAPVLKWNTSPDKIAPGDEVTLNASESYDPDGEIREMIWTFADGTEIKGSEVRKRFDESGPHYFTLTATDNQGLANSSISKEGMVNINHEPYIITEKVVRSNSLDIKLDASETYDVDNDQVFFEWTLPDGSKRNEASFSWRAPEFGVHIVGLTVHDGLGLSNSTNQETIRILVNRPVEANVDSLIATCSGKTVLFNSSSSFDPDGNNFDVTWYFGNGDISKEANPSYIYDAPGVYEARLELSDGITEEKTIAKIPVIVEGSPVAKMNISDTTICVNTALNLDGSNSLDPSGALPSLVWSLGDGTTESGPKVQHVYTEPGIYPLTLTVEGSGSAQCGNTNQVRANVRVIQGPNAVFDLQEWATPGDVITLDGSASSADDDIINAEWRIEYVADGSLETVQGLQASHQFTEPGEYLVTLFLQTNSSTSCNSVTLTKSLKVNAAPKIVWELAETVPAGSDLNLNALQSEDPDGFIKEYNWYLDGELISKNASEIIKTVEPGNHTVVLEVKDNSPSENNKARMEKTFFANSAPHPKITVPGKVYLNREVRLSGSPDTDRDGDQLTSLWKVNNRVIADSAFTPTELRKYRITYVQDDGRGVSNSVDSAVVEIIPVGHPDISPEYPSRISLGGSISISDLKIPDQNDWKFVYSGQFQDIWTANSPGADSLHLMWFFEDRPTSSVKFPIVVSEPLQFVSASDTLRNAEWNPANPFTVIRAPEVNRDVSQVKFTWLRDGEEVGVGYRINLPVQKGENRFTVRVRDLQVKQSSPVETEMVIITE